MKDPSESEIVAAWAEVLKKSHDEFTAIPKPYAPEAWAKLGEEQQGKVQSAEIGACLSVNRQTAYTRDPEHRQWADDFLPRYFGTKTTEEELIDEPLAKMRALAKAYAESGLAGDDAEAKKMADAYKDSIVRQRLGKIDERGRGR